MLQCLHIWMQVELSITYAIITKLALISLFPNTERKKDRWWLTSAARCAEVFFLNLATNFSRDLCSARWVSKHFAQKRNPWLSFFSLVLTFTRRPAWPDFSPQSWIPGRISLDPRDLSNPLTFKCSNQLLGFPLKGSKFLCPNSKRYCPICPLSLLRNF